ncbi:hypothetical protein RND71_023428 [Anisodus tanguticus]|uniref:Uncharacterized protein n=1 Tax=Anisodus tanguticus TaxID=243964 RepID=A0AAE1V623_9SOLA|nr:hypothetical protein RND71_023428 [Anisodus tanguticus]
MCGPHLPHGPSQMLKKPRICGIADAEGTSHLRDRRWGEPSADVALAPNLTDAEESCTGRCTDAVKLPQIKTLTISPKLAHAALQVHPFSRRDNIPKCAPISPLYMPIVQKLKEKFRYIHEQLNSQLAKFGQ